MKTEKLDCNSKRKKKKENADSKFRRHLVNKSGLSEEGTERSRQLDVLPKNSDVAGKINLGYRNEKRSR